MNRVRAQRGSLLSSVVMVMLATVATGLLVVIGFQGLPDTVVPSTFDRNRHESRNIGVTSTPSVTPTPRPSGPPSATAAPPSSTTRGTTPPGVARTSNAPDRGGPTWRPQPTSRPIRSTATTQPPRKTTSPSPSPTRVTPSPTSSTQAPSPAPSCGTGRKPRCPKASSSAQPTRGPGDSYSGSSYSGSGSSAPEETRTKSSTDAKKPAKKSR